MDEANVAQLAALEPRLLALGRLGIFAEASRPVLERLAAESVESAVPAGTTLIREGDEADAFFVLLEGEMAVRARGEGVSEVDLPSMEEGTYFGEIGLLERIPRTATVTAARDSRVLRISGDDFLETLADAPASTALLEGARSRLARTHPTRRATGPTSGR
jgi:CRP-like cAMP-binding protein